MADPLRITVYPNLVDKSYSTQVPASAAEKLFEGLWANFLPVQMNKMGFDFKKYFWLFLLIVIAAVLLTSANKKG